MSQSTKYWIGTLILVIFFPTFLNFYTGVLQVEFQYGFSSLLLYLIGYTAPMFGFAVAITVFIWLLFRAFKKDIVFSKNLFFISLVMFFVLTLGTTFKSDGQNSGSNALNESVKSKQHPALTDSLKKVVQIACNMMNKNAPYRIDSETELMSVMGVDLIIIYKTRLINISINEISSHDLSALKFKVQEGMRNLVTSNPDSKIYLSMGLSFKYIVYDKDLKYMFDYIISQ